MKKKYQIVNVVTTPVIYKDKFLLIKRTKPPYKNLWSMVGGKLEVGEHIEESIVREVKEETTLTVKFIALRGIVSEILYELGKVNSHFLMWVCETEAVNGKAKEQYEGKVKWFTREDLIQNKSKIIPSDYAMINQFFIKKRQSLSLHKAHMHFDRKTYLLEYFGK